jgi:hypothetical protein
MGDLLVNEGVGAAIEGAGIVARAASFTALALAASGVGEFSKDSLHAGHSPTRNPLHSAWSGKDKMERVTFAWYWASDHGTPVKHTPISMQLDFNPTRFRLSRAPYFAAKTSALTKVSEAAYAPKGFKLEMTFMLDNTEVAESKVHDRVLEQMKILSTLTEPTEARSEKVAGEKGFSRPTMTEGFSKTATLRELVGTEPALFRKKDPTVYATKDRQPPALWVVWNKLEFLGTPKSLAFDVQAVDAAGYPRRVTVDLVCGGEALRTSEKYYKPPGGDVELYNTGTTVAPVYAGQTTRATHWKGFQDRYLAKNKSVDLLSGDERKTQHKKLVELGQTMESATTFKRLSHT